MIQEIFFQQILGGLDTFIYCVYFKILLNTTDYFIDIFNKNAASKLTIDL